MSQLRPYQIAARDAAEAYWAAGGRNAGISLFTGGGKTVIFSEINHRAPDGTRTMTLAHRTELIQQAAEKMERWGGDRPAIEMADLYADRGGLDGKSRHVISSIQTQSAGNLRRARTFDPSEFSRIVLDEGQHEAADSFRAVIQHYMQNPDCKFLTVSAGFGRADNQQINCEIVFEYPWAYPRDHKGRRYGNGAIADGYHVPFLAREYNIPTLDFSKVRKSGGDLRDADIDDALREEDGQGLHGIACAAIEAAYNLPRYAMKAIDPANGPAELAKLIEGRKPRSTLIFLPERHRIYDDNGNEVDRLTQLTADILNRWLPNSARQIHGQMDKELRKGIIDGFRDERIPFLCDCMVCIEGFDAPNCSCVVHARPHTFGGPYMQKSARAGRPHGSIADQLSMIESAEERVALIAASAKPNALLVDITGKPSRHLIIRSAAMFCNPKAAEIASQMDQEDGENAQAVADRAEDLLAAVEAAKAAAAQNKLDNEDLLLHRAINQQKKAERAANNADARRGVIGTGALEYKEFDPFKEPDAPVQKPVKLYQETDSQGPMDLTPDERNVADKLIKMGVTPSAANKYAAKGDRFKQAYTVLGRLRQKQCSIPQSKALARLGYTPMEIDGMNFKTASERIDAARQGQGVLNHG